MPSAEDVYITPASRKIEFYEDSTVKGLLEQDGTNMYVSGATDLKLMASDDLRLSTGGGSGIITFAPDNTTKMTMTGGLIGMGRTPTAEMLEIDGDVALYHSASLSGKLITSSTELTVSGGSALNLKGGSGGGVYMMPYGTSAGETLSLKFRELAASGTAAISIRGPDSITANASTLVLPAAAGTADQVLSIASVASDVMALEWADASGGGGTFGGSVSDTYIPIATAADTLGDFLPAYVDLTTDKNVFLGIVPASLTASANYNTSFGHLALENLTDGSNNTALGMNAGNDLTQGYNNVFVGYSAGGWKTTEASNTAVGYAAGPSAGGGDNVNVGTYAGYSHTGNYCVIIGSNAAYNTTGVDSSIIIGRQAWGSGVGTGNDNVVVGNLAMKAGTTSTQNVAIGANAGESVTTAERNVLIGYYAGGSGRTDANNGIFIGSHAGRQSNSAGTIAIGHNASYYPDGDYNIFIGYAAGSGDATTTTAQNNVGIGKYALLSISSSYNNAVLGVSAGQNITTGHNNTLIGKSAGSATTTNSYNVAIGSYALSDADGAGSSTALGYGAMRYSTSDNTTGIGQYALSGATGDKNAALGNSAGGIAKASANSVMVGYEAGYHPTGNYNTWMGYRAGYGVLDQGATNNVGIGREAMLNISTGYENVAVGYVASSDMTTGIKNTHIGSYAGTGNTSGDNNTAVGSSALQENQDGDENTALGYFALYNTNPSSGGGDNVGIGSVAGFTNTTGVRNVFIGRRAGYSNSTASDNIFIGEETAYSNSTGTENVVVGRRAFFYNTTGNYNTVMGHQALYTNVHGDCNTAIGHKALYTYAPADDAGFSTAVGIQALYSATTGINNTAVGALAGYQITEGAYNTMVGNNAGNIITTGDRNTLVGDNAGLALTTEDLHTFVGDRAGQNSNGSTKNTYIGALAGYNADGGYNVMVGANTGQSADTQYQSVFIGVQAGYGSASSGYNNVAIGYQTGYNMTTALANVFVGAGAAYAATTSQKSVVIGTDAGKALTTQGGSVIVGFEAGRLQDTGSGGNVAIGHQALYSGTQNYQDVAIGINAGRKATGAGGSSVFLGRYAGPSTASTISSKLYIHNAEGTPLIYGDFSSAYVTINGNLNTHNIRPLTDNTYTLGTATLRYTTAFLDDYIEINSAGATTDHAGAGRYWVSGTTPFFNNTQILVGAGTVATIGATWTDGTGVQAPLAMAAHDAVANALNTATTAAFLFWNDTTSTLSTKNLAVGSAASFQADTTGVTASAGDNSTKLATTAYADNAGAATPGGSDTQIQFNNGGAFGGISGFTTTDSGDIVTLTSAAAERPRFVIQNTEAGNTPGELRFIKDSASPADNDFLGKIQFYGDDDVPASVQYATIAARSNDVSTASPNGSLHFYALDGTYGNINQFTMINSAFYGYDHTGSNYGSFGAYSTRGMSLTTPGSKLQLQVSGGAGEVQIKAAYVGINTTGPAAKLHIVGAADNTGGIRLDNGSQVTNLYQDASNNFIIDPYNDFIVTGADDIKLASNDDFEFYADDFYFKSGSTHILDLSAALATITGDLNFPTDDSAIQVAATDVVKVNSTYGLVSAPNMGHKHSAYDSNQAGAWAVDFSQPDAAEWAISSSSRMQIIDPTFANGGGQPTAGSTVWNTRLPAAEAGMEFMIFFKAGVNGAYYLTIANGTSDVMYSGSSTSFTSITLNETEYESVHIVSPADGKWSVLSHT